MNTLVLSPRFSADSQCLWQACINLDNWKTHRAYRYNVDGVESPCVYGEMQFCDIIAERLGLGLVEPPPEWLANLPREYTKRTVEFIRHGDLVNLEYLGRRGFYKPANDKVFAHGIYESGRDVPSKYVDINCPVLISDVVEFTHEYRCYVLDRDVKTHSIYEWSGAIWDPNTSEAKALSADAFSFATDVVKDSKVEMPSAFVLDVGLTENKQWMVIEANQAYASGIYQDANPSEVLPVIQRCSCEMSKILESDIKYLRNEYVDISNDWF